MDELAEPKGRYHSVPTDRHTVFRVAQREKIFTQVRPFGMSVSIRVTHRLGRSFRQKEESLYGAFTPSLTY